MFSSHGARRIHHGEEIDRRHQLAVRAGDLVRHVHDVFVRADAVEGRHFVARDFAASRRFSPQPECAGPLSAPCFFAQRSVFRPSVGQ